jgi:hypothetical protein
MRRLRALVLDMDGTLTMPGAIDFARMRARLLMPPAGGDILTHVASDPALQSARAAIVEE